MQIEAQAKANELLNSLRQEANMLSTLALIDKTIEPRIRLVFSLDKPINKFYDVNENFLLGIQQPQNNSFKGKVLFLIDGLCFSTTADFCAIIFK